MNSEVCADDMFFIFLYDFIGDIIYNYPKKRTYAWTACT
jgi:hypothetical protein